MTEYEENAKFASICLALAASEKCEDWSNKQIEDFAHKLMDQEIATHSCSAKSKKLPPNG